MTVNDASPTAVEPRERGDDRPGSAPRFAGADPFWFAAPVIIAAIVSFRREWTPIGDLALVELKLRQIWSNPPLVGPYSRFGWSHPGPALYWLYWLPWRIVGGGARGLLFATLVWHAAASALSLWLARRCGGRRVMVMTSVVLFGTAFVSQTDALIQPWNPFLNLTLVPALVFSFVEAGRGDRVGSLWFVAVASVMAQNHLGLLPPALALGGIVAAAYVARFAIAIRRNRDPDSSTPGASSSPKPLAVSIALSSALGLAIWALPIVEQLRRSPGNFRLIWTFAREPKDRLGLAAALRLLGRMLGPVPPWIGIRPPQLEYVGGIDLTTASWRTVPVLAVVPISALAVAWRRKDWRSLRLLVGTAVVVATGFAATVNLSGLPHEYLVAWISVTCALWVALGIWTATTSFRMPSVVRSNSGRWTGLSLALFGSLLGGSTVIAPDPYLFLEPSARTLSSELIETLGSTPGAVDFVSIADLESSYVLSAIVRELEEDGWRTYVPASFATVGFDGSRVSPRRDPARVKLTIASGLNAKNLGDEPTLERIAEFQPFSPKDRARIWQLAAQLRATENQPDPTEAEKQERFFAAVEMGRLRGDQMDVSIFRHR